MEKNNWQRDKNELAKNVDLWEKLLIFLETHKVEIIWVKGHAGNAENEVCDKLAVKNATIAKNKNNGLR